MTENKQKVKVMDKKIKKEEKKDGEAKEGEVEEKVKVENKIAKEEKVIKDEQKAIKKAEAKVKEAEESIKAEAKKEKAENTEDDDDCEESGEKDKTDSKIEAAISALKAKTNIKEFGKTMKSNKCFYIRSVRYPDLGLAIDINKEYNNTKTKAVLFNIDLHRLIKGRKTNIWAYDENTRAITNAEHPHMAMFAG